MWQSAQAPQEEVWEVSKFPEAILCRHNGEESGIILPHSPRVARNFNIEWDVVIDLGTVNTSVFYRQGAQEPNPMEFKGRCVQIIKLTEHVRELFLNRVFFSPKTYRGIFSTSFIRLTPSVGVLNPVIDGKLQLGSSEDWFSWMKEEPFFLEQLRVDLKWSRDQDEISCLYAYFKYLALRICAEAAEKGVNRINLKWSYPSAFSEDMRISLGGAFTSLPHWVRGIQKAIEVTIKEEDQQGETESVAVCKYLSSIGPGPDSDFLPDIVPARAIADIGGGTTDIGIWKEDQIIFQTSILLAGKILTEYIRAREDLRKDILFSLHMPTEGFAFDYFTHMCAHSINNLMKDRHDQLYPLFTVDKPMNQEVGYKQARSIIFLIFAGTIYYIGLILKQIETPPIGIWFAGNGSKLINLVHPQSHPYLKRFLPTEIELVDIIPANPSHTKQEVARGVLSNIVFKTSAHPRFIIGEDGYKFGGRETQFSKEIRLENLISDKVEVPRDYSQLSRFLDIYNKCAGALELVPLEVTRDINLKIWQKMEGRINGLKNMAQNCTRTGNPYQGLIQPFLVEELKVVIQETLYKR